MKIENENNDTWLYLDSGTHNLSDELKWSKVTP
jgi:hypothetical protein